MRIFLVIERHNCLYVHNWRGPMLQSLSNQKSSLTLLSYDQLEQKGHPYIIWIPKRLLLNVSNTNHFLSRPPNLCTPSKYHGNLQLIGLVVSLIPGIFFGINLRTRDPVASCCADCMRMHAYAPLCFCKDASPAFTDLSHLIPAHIEA